ncbi:MAG: hypothetical protein QNK36_12370 [Colwellia sp.]|nr:hypothetical protein [Colwellia sp.]
MTLYVDSYGIVKPKYETELVAQVSGQIVELFEVFVRGGFVAKGQLRHVLICKFLINLFKSFFDRFR